MNKKTKTGGSLVYCGPNIKGVARQYTVYSNGLPQPLKEAAAADKALAGLILPLAELPDAMKQIWQRDGRIYTYYKRVLNVQKG